MSFDSSAASQRYLKTTEFANRIGMTTQFVRDRIREGSLPAFRVGKHTFLIREDDAEKFIEQSAYRRK